MVRLGGRGWSVGLPGAVWKGVERWEVCRGRRWGSLFDGEGRAERHVVSRRRED